MSDAPLPLDATEARILGSLVEKAATTPDAYPLTLNAVVVACNQKTSREPVMKLEPGAVGHALRKMAERGLVKSDYGARAERFEHRGESALGLTRQQLALVALLMLRGPQTANELLTRSERLARFADVDDLLHALERLAAKDPALVVRLPKAPGQREERWMHLLCGPVDVEALAAAHAASRSASREDDSALDGRVAALEAELAQLRERLESLEAALGGS
jgi:uncharacterized protein